MILLSIQKSFVDKVNKKGGDLTEKSATEKSPPNAAFPRLNFPHVNEVFFQIFSIGYFDRIHIFLDKKINHCRCDLNDISTRNGNTGCKAG